MRVLLTTYGSRGDVEPIAGLAAALRQLGAEVRVCAPPDDEFAEVLARAGVAPEPGFAPLREWVTRLKTRPPTDPAQLAADIVETAGGIVASQFQVMDVAAEGCDAILATGLFPSAATAHAVAERRGIPFAFAAFCPLFLPSEHNRPHAYPTHPHPPGVTDNRVLWERDVETRKALFGESVNGLRTRIGLPALDNIRDPVLTARPWLAVDPILGPWQTTDLRDDVVQTGAWLLPDERPLPDALTAFLEAGPAPVFIGFGSMPMAALKSAAESAVAVARAQGRRAVVSRGWAGLELDGHPDDVIVVGEINQQALFRQVAAVLHHGGAGTTTAAARAGAPQIIVPQVADQPYWAARVASLGIGAAHAGLAPTIETLSPAFATALSPDTRLRAQAVAGSIRSDGALVAARRLLFGATPPPA